MMLVITLPDLVALSTAAIAVAGAIFGVWWRTAFQVATARADELDKSLSTAHERNKEILERLQQALVELGEAKKTIERYEALPNLERVVALMSETSLRQEDRFTAQLAEAERRADARAAGAVQGVVVMLEQHEKRADERHKKMIGALEEITTHLKKLNGVRS